MRAEKIKAEAVSSEKGSDVRVEEGKGRVSDGEKVEGVDEGGEGVTTVAKDKADTKAEVRLGKTSPPSDVSTIPVTKKSSTSTFDDSLVAIQKAASLVFPDKTQEQIFVLLDEPIGLLAKLSIVRYYIHYSIQPLSGCFYLHFPPMAA